MSGLAIRRHHSERMFAKRLRMLQEVWRMDDPKWCLYTARKMRDTNTPCSCPMCGNPRRHFGHRTMQEKRAGILVGSNVAALD